MARGCSDSDSEEERHDRFKSERNPRSVPVFRSNIPSSLDTYSSRARSPLRQNSYKSLKHKSRYSEERRYSPHRRAKSPERRGSRDKRTSPKESRSSSSERRHSRHKHRKSHEKLKSDRYEEESRVRSLEKELKNSDRRRYDEQDDTLLDRKKSEDKEERISDHKYDDSENERKLKKHKRSHDRSQNHDGKRKKKEKKHKRKHEKHDKKKSDKESILKIVDGNNLPNSEPLDVEDSVDLTKEPEHSECDLSNSDDTENDVSQENSSPHHDNVTSPGRKRKGRESEHEEGEISGSESEQYFGPALPPGKKTEKCYGPTMPADVDQYGPAMPPEEDQYGPALPPSHPVSQEKAEEEDEPGDVIGPLPVGHESTAQAALDARASLLKYHMDNKPEEDETRKREAWMLELPEARGAQLGLGARTFRKNPVPDVSDRSSWTDTPEDKARKKMLGGKEDSCEVDSKKLEIQERNKEMELLAKKSEKKSKSLLEMHQKELKKKKKKEEKERGGKPPERIPFSRENDLQTHKFDEAQKRSIIKKAQFLDSRFAIGESKYL